MDLSGDLSGHKVLVVIAHPDDETLGCGASLSRAKRQGASCRVLLPLRRGDPRGVEHWPAISANFHAACSLLGADSVVVEDGVVDLWADTQIEQIRAAIDPHVEWADVVLTHHAGDVHQAHRAVSRAVEISTRPFRRRRNVASFEVPTSTDQAFHAAFSPDAFVILGDEDVRAACSAMALYATEQASGRTAADLRAHRAYRGRQIGCDYAEAFSIERAFF